jgi:hypothetical protein
MDAKVKQAFEVGIRQKEAPALLSQGRDDIVVTDPKQIPYYVDFAEVINGLPDLIILELTQDSVLEYRMAGQTVWRRYPDGLVADIPLEIEGEGWLSVRFTPVALPVTIKYYTSRTPTLTEAETKESTITALKRKD